jgi:hypothetical protein
MLENELHKVIVDGEPEPTAVVEAYVKLHSKIAIIMYDVDVKHMVCDENENVEMIRHTQALGKWVISTPTGTCKQTTQAVGKRHE